MILFDQILGHEKAAESLKNALSTGKPPHALVFSGPSGVGKKMMAFAWAQGLLCESGSGRPCGQCSACKRISKRQHPDIHFIGPDGASIKVEQVRELQNFTSLRSYEGRGKVAIIDDAHLLGSQAGNALLKTLEEPPEKTFFVLVTPQKGALLTTIQSRCQKVQFGSLTDSDLKKIVPDLEPWVLGMAHGRADQALKLQNPEFNELRRSAIRSLANLFQARTFEGFQDMNEFSEDRDRSLFAIQCWMGVMRRALSLKLGAKSDVAPDEKGLVSELQTRAEAVILERLGQKLLQLEQDIVHNVHKALAFEEFWLQAKEILKISGGPIRG